MVFGMQKVCLWKYEVRYTPLVEEKDCRLYYDESSSKMILLYRERAAYDSMSITIDTTEDPAVLARLAPEATLGGNELMYSIPLDDTDDDLAIGWKVKTVQLPYLEYTSLRWGMSENGKEAQPDQELGILLAPENYPALPIREFTDVNWTRGILNEDPHQLILKPGVETVVPGQYYRTESGLTVRILSAVLDSNNIWRLTLDQEVSYDDGGPNQLLPILGDN